MTTQTGMAEYYDPKYFYKIEDYGLSEAPIYGRWIDPDVDSAAAQLRYVYEHRQEALRKGNEQPSTFAGSSPWRRSRRTWEPSWRLSTSFFGGRQ